MSSKLKNNLYYLSCITIAILSIVLFRLLKVYDIFCLVLGIASPIIFGFIFAWVLYPIYKKMNEKCSRLVSLFLLIIAFLLFYLILLLKLIPIVIENAGDLLNLFSEYTEKLSKIPVLEGLNNYKSLDMNLIIESCGNLVSILGIISLVHIFGFYMLYNYESIVSFLKNLIPSRHKHMTLSYVRKMSTNMRAYIKGTLIDTLFLFAMSCILYLIIGLKYPFMLAFTSAVTNIIPFVGPYIGGVPAVLVGLKSGLRKAIITVGAIVLAQTVESNIINPMIMSKCIKVNPLLIIIMLTIMGKFFGLLGMIFAVPLLIILKLTLEFIKKYRNLPKQVEKML